MSNIKPTIRPLPYFSIPPDNGERELAAALRREFVPKIARRLPAHHLRGFEHGFIPSFVRKHKQRYPYFLRTDITGFYPNIRHTDLIVGVQLAYREILGLDYVPSSFKKRYVGRLHQWCGDLPLNNGIPLGSPLSAIAAPLMLVPLWLEIKRLYNVPFIVYMDDVLLFAESPHQAADMYAFLENRLYQDFGLTLNTGKTTSGRFSRTRVEYCGWCFSGGYAVVSEHKTDAFRQRITDETKRCAGGGIHSLIKRINRKIDGFGHYYKYGNVTRLFEALDVFVRSVLRKRLVADGGGGRYDNRRLETLGLHSLTAIHTRLQGRERNTDTVSRPVAAMNRKTRYEDADNTQLAQTIEKIQRQLTQLLSLQRRQVRLMESVITAY